MPPSSSNRSQASLPTGTSLLRGVSRWPISSSRQAVDTCAVDASAYMNR
jgi:hypothetical protein